MTTNGYTRQSSGLITNGAIIQDFHFNDEYDAIELAFNATVGHNHDGTAGGGALINLATSTTGTLPFNRGGTGLASGTSGGIPYFSGTTALASSALLTQYALVLGGGAGAAPYSQTGLGTTAQVLHGNASGAPVWAAVGLTTDVSGILPSANGGTGNGFAKFSGPTTSEKTFTLPDATCTILTTNTAVTVAQGGTGQTSYTNGQLLIGNTTGNTLAKGTLTAPAAGITITNGTGTITFALANDLSAVEGLSSNGIAARTATDTWTTRSIASGSSNLTLSNADGVSGNPTLTVEETVWIALSDETTAITTGTNKATMVFPYDITVTGVGASLNTVSSSGTPTVDINESGTTIMAVNKIVIDANEKTTLTAATAPVVSDTAIAAGNEVGFDIDVAGTGAKGLKVWIKYKRTS